MDATCSFCYIGPPYLHERDLCHPLRTGEGNVQEKFYTTGDFIHFYQLRAMGLVWLNGERRAHSQRGGWAPPLSPPAKWCGVQLEKESPMHELSCIPLSQPRRHFMAALGGAFGDWEEALKPWCQWGRFPRWVFIPQVVREESSRFCAIRFPVSEPVRVQFMSLPPPKLCSLCFLFWQRQREVSHYMAISEELTVPPKVSPAPLQVRQKWCMFSNRQH